MENESINPSSAQRFARNATFIFASGISVILLIAAYGKFFYPAKGLVAFDRGVSVLEVVMAAAIFYFRRSFLLWSGFGLLFASWGGYAYFWYSVQLPCGCLGELISVPSVLSIALDAFFFVGSLAMARLWGASKSQLYSILLGGMFMALVGYALADELYQLYILKEYST